MITGIVLENFKCFRKVEINPKRVTCFVGANGTGKSSVLQAFGLLKQTVEQPGGLEFADLDSRKGMAFPFQGPLVNLNNPDDYNSKFGDKDPILHIQGEGVGPEDYSCSMLLFSYSIKAIDNGNIPENADLFLDLKDLRMVPVLRGLTRPLYRLGDSSVRDVTLEGGFTQQEEQTATNLAYSGSSIEKMSRMLKRVTEVELRAYPVPGKDVEIDTLTPSGPVNIVSEGFGTNSLIMLLLQLVSAEKGATVMIEEPEIHLHPKAQAELAEVITEVALEEDKQVIMTTHSEHITGRLLTLVAEGKLTPDDVAIYAFEKDEEGVCDAKNLKINPEGTIEGSIHDFFEVNLAEMNRFAQAQFTRLRSEE